MPSPARLLFAICLCAVAIGFAAAAIQAMLTPVGRLSIDEAMRAAEKRIGGTAAYDIELIMPDGSVRSMLIDTQTGLAVDEPDDGPSDAIAQLKPEER